MVGSGAREVLKDENTVVSTRNRIRVGTGRWYTTVLLLRYGGQRQIQAAAIVVSMTTRPILRVPDISILPAMTPPKTPLSRLKLNHSPRPVSPFRRRVLVSTLTFVDAP